MCFIKETPWVGPMCISHHTNPFLTSLHIKLIKKTINNNSNKSFVYF